MNLAKIGRQALGAALLLTTGLVAAYLAVLYSDHSSWLPSAKWIGFFGYTILIFWGVVREFRRSWNVRSFWIWTVALVVIHTLVYLGVLARVTNWRVIWFLPVSIVEFIVLTAALDRLGFDSTPTAKGTSVASRDIGNR